MLPDWIEYEGSVDGFWSNYKIRPSSLDSLEKSKAYRIKMKPAWDAHAKEKELELLNEVLVENSWFFQKYSWKFWSLLFLNIFINA